LRVLFFGSSSLSCRVLDALSASSHTVAGVVTQPDQPAGRRMELRATPVGEAVAGTPLPLFKPEKLRRNAALREALGALQPEALAVASYGKLVPPWLLELTPWPLNVHPSPLPLLRGPSPLRTALLDGWGGTEVCIMRMTERLDDGPLLLRRPLAIPAQWNYEELDAAAGQLGGELLVEALTQAEAGQAVLAPQDEAAATYTRVFNRGDTWIDWTQPAMRLADFVRAWDPDIGACSAFTHRDGTRRLKVWRAVAQGAGPGAGQSPGEVVTAEKDDLLVQTGDGLLRLLEVQPENRPRMSAASFNAGQHLRPGMLLGGNSTR
jgi:methionyl-tRNA formyltransferase